MSVLAQTILAVAQQQAESASALQAENANLRRQLEYANRRVDDEVALRESFAKRIAALEKQLYDNGIYPK